jgi:hypothetical protein
VTWNTSFSGRHFEPADPRLTIKSGNVFLKYNSPSLAVRFPPASTGPIPNTKGSIFDCKSGPYSERKARVNQFA